MVTPFQGTFVNCLEVCSFLLKPFGNFVETLQNKNMTVTRCVKGPFLDALWKTKTGWSNSPPALPNCVPHSHPIENRGPSDVASREPCFFLLFTGYIFSSCLRVAYALPTPLRCFPTRGLFVLICLRVPTLTSCFLILPTRLACVASVGFLLVLILHILPTRWAPVLSVEVVFFVLLGIATPGCRTLPPTPPTQKKISTNILKMPTESLRAQAKCLRQHFTRHTLHKLNLPTKKRCSRGKKT